MKESKQNKKKMRVRQALKKNNKADRFRLTVFKSSRNFSAQIIDDKNSKTIVSASSLDKTLKNNKNNKSDVSKNVAILLAAKAIEKNIKKIYLDRGPYKYHGRVKVFAETLREKGMEF